MKLHKIAASCALVCAALSGQAYAAAPSNGAFGTADLDVFLSGASAPQNILSALAASMFESGYYSYNDDGGTFTAASTSDDGKQERAYYGVVKAGAGVDPSLVGQKVRLQHRARGGSVFGVDPVARATAIKNMKVAAANCVATDAPTNTKFACNEVGSDTNALDANNRVPDFGVSDVEPSMFKFPYNTEFGQGQLTTTELGRLTWVPTNAVAFGVVATNSVPAGTYISRSVYGSMLSGSLQDWSLVDATVTTNPQVVVCRRTPGSGTQATYNQFFNHFPCESGSIAGTGSITISRITDSASYVLGTVTGVGTTASPYIINPNDGYTVVENPSSGNVRDCLKAAFNHTDYDFTSEDGVTKFRVKFSNSTSAFNAIGVLSLDSAGSESGWSFRNLDGIAPTKPNMRDGKYDLVSEATMQYRNGNNGSVALPAAKQLFVDAFITRAGDPDVLLQIDAEGVRNSVIAVPVGANDPNDATVVTHTVKVGGVPTVVTSTLGSNVAKGTHGGNTCTPISVFY